jgi:hypothetical protein
MLRERGLPKLFLLTMHHMTITLTCTAQMLVDAMDAMPLGRRSRDAENFLSSIPGAMAATIRMLAQHGNPVLTLTSEVIDNASENRNDHCSIVDNTKKA